MWMRMERRRRRGASRWTLVQHLFLLHALHVLVLATSESSDLRRWDFWPPLPGQPRVSTYLSARPGGIHLTRQHFDVLDVFALTQEEQHANVLLYGNVLLRPWIASSSQDLHSAGVQNAAQFARTQLAARQIHVSKDVQVTGAVMLPLQLTPDNGASEMVVLHEYQDYMGHWGGFKSHVQLGINYALTLEDAHFGLKHQVVVALDRDHEFTLLQHTATALDPSQGQQIAPSCSADDQACLEQGIDRLRVLTFNVWNTNPTADVYGSSNRWSQYNKRLDHLVKAVHKANPAIIGFQELRYDDTLGGVGQHAQIEHLAKALPDYQYVFQPAMSYINERNPYQRVEEGPAVFSRYPIVSTDYLLLGRDPNNPNDSHQRVCLHAVVDYPSWGLVDVYVTHLSLSERSREQSMLEIWRFMQQGHGVTQVLLGDMNAEPQSRGIRFLAGEVELHGEKTDLHDAWLELHEEPTPGSSDPKDRETKFTFPSDNPTKRIDFIFYHGQGHVARCDVLAQTPTADTAKYPKDVGMLDVHSPVYASDHRAVLAEFTL